MSFKYYWKELSKDGLLKDPDPVGPYYSQYSLGIYGFNSREEAVARYEEFFRIHGPYEVDRSLVLIEVYEVEGKDK